VGVDADRAERVQAALLAVLLVAVPLLWSSSFTRYIVFKQEILTIGAFLVVGIHLAMSRAPFHAPTLRSAFPFLAVGVSAVASTLYAHNRHDGVQYALRLIALVALFGTVWRALFCTRTILRLMRFAAIAALVTLAVGCAAGIVAAQRDRFSIWAMVPTFRNPNYAAQYLVATIPAACACADAAVTTARRWFWVAAAAALAVFLAATGSRGGYLGIFVGGTVWALYAARSKGWLARPAVKRGLTVVCVLLIAVTIVVVPILWKKTIESKQEMVRPQLWVTALRMVSASPVLGVGPGNFPIAFGYFDGYKGQWAPDDQYRIQFVHNDYLEFAAEYGLLGLLALGWLILRSVVRLWRAPAPEPGSRDFIAAGPALAAVSGVLAHATVSFPFLMPAPALLFWVNLGFVAVLAERLSGKAPEKGPELSLPSRPAWWGLCAACVVAASAMPFMFLMSDYYLARAKYALEFIRTEKDPEKNARVRQAIVYAQWAVDKSLSYDVNSRSAWFHKGMACTFQRKPSEALEAYTRAIALLPDYHVQHFNLAHVHAQMGNLESAEDEFVKATKIHDRYGPPHRYLGDIYLKQGKKKEAAEAYEKAGVYDPSLIRFLTKAATIYARLGMREEADRCIREYEAASAPQRVPD